MATDDTTGAPVAPPPKRVRGQRMGNRPRPDHYYEIKRRFVEGEPLRRKEDGNFERPFLSTRELGKAYTISHSVVAFWAKRDNWMVERENFKLRAAVEADRIRSEQAATARAQETVDAEAVVDDYIRLFAANLKTSKVRVDSIVDFNTAARLKSYLQKEAPREKPGGVVSLETLQQRHAALRTGARSMPIAMTGAVPADALQRDDAADGVRVADPIDATHDATPDAASR